MRKIKTSIILVLIIGGIFALATTVPVQAQRKDESWYFDNFTDEDRLSVRKAMDFAIPRQRIIDSVLLGQGFMLATPIEANAIGYDASIQPREFSIEKGLEEMEKAFGYKYNDSAETDEERKGYFSMVIMAPTSRDDRMEWAALTTKTFQEIGIDVTLKYANWNIAVGVFSPPEEEQGFDYEHGGYDAFFIGWTGSPNSDVSQWFGRNNWAPFGTNIGYIDDATVDDLINKSLSHPDKATRLQALKDFQIWFKANLPYFIMLQLADLWALDPDLEGVSLSFDYPNFGNWSHPTADAVTVQTPGDLKDMNPLMVGSYYDWLAGVGNLGCFGSLINRFPDNLETWYGDIAESWSISDDGLEWVFNIHDGIKFSDGSDCTVDDVIFTYKQFINPEVVAYGGTSQAEYMNASNIVKVNDTAVKFTLNKFYAYGESLFTQSILSETEMSAVPNAQWGTHATTTTYIPLGTGPYKMDKGASDVSQSQVKLVLNTHYDNTIRDNLNFNNPDRIPVINCKLISTAASAIAALKTGEINIIDSNVAIQPYLSEINASSWGRLDVQLGWGHQGFYINQMNPIWGMNAQDPREMYPEDYAQAPFDLAAVFVAILTLASIQIIRKKKK